VTADDLPNWRLAKAERFLQAADRAFAAGDWETSASRAYYAAYHAVVALVESRSDLEVPRRHAQLHNLLRSSRMASLMSHEDTDDAFRLYQERLAADYEMGSLTDARAQDSIRRARQLCEKIRREIADEQVQKED
jgi:uncharacterized protein (UPF0332 family)